MVGSKSRILCPQIIDYSARFKARFADEMRKLAEDSALIVAMQDYLSLRDQLRECSVKIVVGK